MTKNKVKTRDELRDICAELKKSSKKIGFTSGAFDLLHAGHVDYLEQARSMCDVLIVGVNSDESVKSYKGENRPLNSESHRARVVAALQCVDFVFIFNERRNAKNIELLQPDFYFKAGDYSESQLTSKAMVEKYGGKAVLIPVRESVSTTQIIQKIAHGEGAADKFVEETKRTVHLQRKPPKMSPAIFLDRDGTINKEVGYLSDPEDLEFLPTALAGMKKFRDMGYRLVIVTNQGGIGLGYFTKNDFYRVNKRMLTEVSRAGILIDKIYFCPHSLAENCPCRKPNTGLVMRAKEELNIDLKNSFFIGDSPWDIETGKNSGMRTIWIRNDRTADPETWDVKPDFIVDDLLEAAELVLRLEREKSKF
ncbi:MAG: HAD-IIIA family hydrolase [Calditrichaeota bacterium]|nr:HAD-IIIA family hydrolase [Calditrichota bacterium]